MRKISSTKDNTYFKLASNNMHFSQNPWSVLASRRTSIEKTCKKNRLRLKRFYDVLEHNTRMSAFERDIYAASSFLVIWYDFWNSYNSKDVLIFCLMSAIFRCIITCCFFLTFKVLNSSWKACYRLNVFFLPSFHITLERRKKLHVSDGIIMPLEIAYLLVHKSLHILRGPRLIENIRN